jgi:DNA-binding Xre family transcriptional regulator
MRLNMKVSYIKLWKLLLDKRMKKSELRDLVKMSPNTLAKLGKDEMISMDVIVRICQVLKCDIGDIMEVIPEEDDEDGVRNKI